LSTADGYRQRRDSFLAQERELAGRSLRLSLARLIAFLLGAVCLLVAFDLHPRSLWLAASGLGFAAFVVLAVRHARLLREQRRYRDLAEINREAVCRLERSWGELSLPSLPPLAEEPPRARDLNLLGRASLYHLLGTVHTPPGKAALASWLLHAAAPEEIAQRQGAVRELAPALDLRQELEVRVRSLEKISPDCERFLGWAEDRPWLSGRRGLLAFVRVWTAVSVGLIVAFLFGLSVPLFAFVLVVIVNLIVSRLHLEKVEAAFDRSSAREGEFQLYARGLETLASSRFESARLRGLQSEWTLEGKPAHAWMDLLHRRMTLADSRRAALLHTPLQLLFLWDFHVLERLERWQAVAGPHARRWLEALGEFEALSALAVLAHDHPSWTYPEVGVDRLEAKNLGHPLLPDTARVGNDVTVGPPGTVLLVTGSNMSGKSTLLRSIGINAVLAQAGAPVCAGELRMPPLRIATSILVEDSLADGVSFFMSELKRVKQVVDEAALAAGEGKLLLYLLDEILRGTNSEERQIAVRRVLGHLLKSGAIGAISTHDLQLAEIADLRSDLRPVHFRESFEDGGMTFDYRMREGVATTVNALKLLEMVGLGESPRPEPPFKNLDAGEPSGAESSPANAK
jgi:hypothetical protein